jgi:hypothetical protein
LPPWFAFGELYADGSEDDPDELAWLIELLLDTTFVMTELDGEVLLAGTGSELADYNFGPTYFDEPVYYAEETPYGSVAALWAVGVGSVYHALPPGEHTLVQTHFSPLFGQTEPQVFIYHIVVGK